MGDISELIGRLEKLTGPSGAIDAELYATVGGAPHTTTAGGRTIPLIEIGDPSTWPPYTASLDSAIALVECLLPGWGWTTGKTPDGMAMAGLRRPTPRGPAPERGVDRLDGNVAIALLIAALKAKGGVE